MFPVLFTIGNFHFQTIWIFAILATLVFSYIVFLQSEDQILPTTKVFDLVAISAILGLVSGRVTETILRFSEIGFSQFFTIWETTGVNLWGTVVGGLITAFYFAHKFKLSKTQVVDIFSLAAIPAALVIYLGRIFELGVTFVNIFALVWFLTAAILFFKASRKIQFPGFYLLLAGVAIAFPQIIFELFRPSLGVQRVFNLTISASVLTISGVMFYKKSNAGLGSILLMISGKTLEQIKKRLLRQKGTLESELVTLKKDDPFSQEERLQTREAGEDAYEFEGHERITVVRDQLKIGLRQIKRALAAIGVGKYGKCERCGQEIPEARLKVLPEATLCFRCEKEVEGKA